MKSKLWLGVSIFLAGCLGWLAVQNRRLTAEIERDQRSRRSVTQGVQENRPSRPDGRGTGQTSASRPPPHGPVRPDAPGPSVAARWDDPAWRAARFDEAYLRVETDHGRFFQRLAGWPPERVEALKRQLANNSLALMQAATQTTFPNAYSDAKSLGEAIQTTQEKNQQQLLAVLGAEDYAAFEKSQLIETYRDSVATLTNAMRSRNVQITGDQEESILTAYANAIQDSSKDSSPDDISQLSPGQVAALKQKRLDAFHRVLLGKMSAVLDQNQLTIFMEAEMERQGGG